MKAKSGSAILMSMGLLLTLCFGSPIVGEAAEDKKEISTVKAEGDSLSKYLGVWYDKAAVDSGQAVNGNPNVKLVVTGITNDKLLFSICQQYCMLESAVATKQEDGSYQFSFREVKEEFLTNCSYGTEYTGSFTFNDMKLTAEIDGSKIEGIGYVGELVYYNGLKEGTHCNLVDFMTDYKTANYKVVGNPAWNLSLVEDKVTITIPKGITLIGKGAFSIDGDTTFPDQINKMKKVSLCIPKNVKIAEDAFRTIGPMNITFEEGRTKIEKKAFIGCSDFLDGRHEEIEITLPSTIKSIGESSFATSFGSGITLNLNEGLEEIGDSALSGTKCKLPSTVKKLGDYALYNWWYDSEAEGELSGGYVVLPKGLTEIGNYCIYLEMPTKKIKIPPSVKKIGVCPISYGDNAYMGGVLVDKENRYYKSDKNGWLYTKDGKKLLYAASFSGDLVVPEGVEYVGEGSLNLDLNGEGGPQKIILPKSLKKYNQRAGTNKTIVFKGDPPILVGKKEGYFFQMTFYVPKSKLKAYKKTFRLWGSDCKIIGQ